MRCLRNNGSSIRKYKHEEEVINMKKYFKIAVLTFLAVGLMSGSAFAAASLNAGNTTIASELVPAAGIAVPAPGVNNAYEPNGSVAASSQIKISLANGTFGAGFIDLCDNGGTAYLAAPVATVAGATSVTVTTNLALSSGVVYNFQPAACAAGPHPLTNINIAAGAAGGSVVTMTVDNALNPGDTNIFATATVITLVDQFSIVFTPVTSTITFASGMKLLNGVPTSTVNFNILSNESIGTKVNTGLASNAVCGAMAAGAGKALAYTVTPGTGFNFSGIAATTGFGYTIAGAGFTVLDSAIATADPSASGNAETATFRVCGTGTTAVTRADPANLNQLILTVDGVTVLTPRTYNIKIDTVTGAIFAASPRTLVPTTLGWNWVIDSSQYYIPLVGSSTGRETYIKLQSKNLVANANGVSVAILAKDGTTVATYTTTITPGTPTTITGAQLVAAATAAGKTVDGAAGFAVIVTVNAPENDVFAYANMIDAAGAKRVPVKTVGGKNVE
jgi:hypothetical protein